MSLHFSSRKWPVLYTMCHWWVYTSVAVSDRYTTLHNMSLMSLHFSSRKWPVLYIMCHWWVYTSVAVPSRPIVSSPSSLGQMQHREELKSSYLSRLKMSSTWADWSALDTLTCECLLCDVFTAWCDVFTVWCDVWCDVFTVWCDVWCDMFTVRCDVMWCVWSSRKTDLRENVTLGSRSSSQNQRKTSTVI